MIVVTRGEIVADYTRTMQEIKIVSPSANLKYPADHDMLTLLIRSVPAFIIYMMIGQRNEATLFYAACNFRNVGQIGENIDDQLFNRTVENSNHALHTVLPPPSVASQHYNLRRRTHSLSLPDHDNYLSDCNFVTRMLYKQCY